MPKIQNITDHASKVRGGDYRMTQWRCKHCSKVYDVYYDDFKNLRAHMRTKHPIEYKPYTINEEPDYVVNDHMSLLRA